MSAFFFFTFRSFLSCFIGFWMQLLQRSTWLFRSLCFSRFFVPAVFIFSYSVEIWHFVFFFRLRFLLFSMFVLSVCLQIIIRWAWYSPAVPIFYRRLFFCFLWLAGHCLIGCDHRGNTFAMVFIQYSHFFLLFLPFFRVGVSCIFVYAGKTAFVCILCFLGFQPDLSGSCMLWASLSGK